MDFASPLIESESIVTKSKIRYLDPIKPSSTTTTDDDDDVDLKLDNAVIAAANDAASELFLRQSTIVVDGDQQQQEQRRHLIDASRFRNLTLPMKTTIQEGDLVVIQESFDRLNFVYAKRNAIYSNRNGHFHHNDFIDQLLPFGSKLRARNNGGFGFCYLLKPTAELWTRSLNHRTQIVHELDQSQIVFQLNLKPGMTVVESGTGSAAVSHAIVRTIAPTGRLHTYEFNQHRCETAQQEFKQHKIAPQLVSCHHRDVCADGFGEWLDGRSVDAVFLDLPEPWTAVPHAAHILKCNARIATYSPCVEQTQRTVEALETAGFHSIQTMEYRLQEHYVDLVKYEGPPTAKRPKLNSNEFTSFLASEFEKKTKGQKSKDDDEEDQNETKTKENTNDDNDDEEDHNDKNDKQESNQSQTQETKDDNDNDGTTQSERKRSCKEMLVARPFVTMRGHTAYLTFATAGNIPQPNPKNTETKT